MQVTKFHKWVKKQPVTALAYQLGVTENAVRNWSVYGKTPKDEIKRKIVKLSKKEIIFEDFFK